MSAALNAARARLARAQLALDDHLAAGGDTTEARRTTEQAQADVDRLEAEAEAAASREAAGRAAGIASAAAAAADAVRTSLEREVAAFVAVPVPAIDLPTVNLVALGAARERLAVALQEQAAARQHVTDLEARAAAITEKREAIIARRAEGAARDTDAAEVALFDADLTGLTVLLERARREAEGPTQAAAQAQAAVAGYESAVAADTAQALATAMAQVCQALEAALVAAATALYPMRGTIPAWRPGNALKHLVGFGSPQHRSAA